ncbi:hypothetical protein EG329_009219 [Mollisiaceae sp. DMI_Dod_QoI]|nr:hypothetical protein EG329_009219 [Helotiales sp. DMI_Dod_QoI]
MIMLSTIGRAAVRRVVARGPQSTNRSLQSVWQLQRVAAVEQADKTSSRSHALFQSRRSYATTTKAAPKSKSKSKSTTAAKPKTKKAPVKKAVKKPAKRKRPVLKKKPVKKPVKPKKVLTEAQKENIVLKKLKTTALTVPTFKPATAWLVFATERVKEQTKNTKTGAAPVMKGIAENYKSLSPSELESLNHAANQNKAANKIQYKQWVESHTPDQIREANNARRLLKKKLKSNGYPPIQDSRLPKRATSARFLFIQDRYASGDLKSIGFTEAAHLLAKEWDALPASERKVGPSP